MVRLGARIQAWGGIDPRNTTPGRGEYAGEDLPINPVMNKTLKRATEAPAPHIQRNSDGHAAFCMRTTMTTTNAANGIIHNTGASATELKKAQIPSTIQRASGMENH